MTGVCRQLGESIGLNLTQRSCIVIGHLSMTVTNKSGLTFYSRSRLYHLREIFSNTLGSQLDTQIDVCLHSLIHIGVRHEER